MPDIPTEGRDGITRTPRSDCAYCGRTIDASCVADGGDEEIPGPGDVTICLRCGGLLLFDAAMVPRKPTDPELCRLMMSTAWPDVMRARRSVAAAIHARAR